MAPRRIGAAIAFGLAALAALSAPPHPAAEAFCGFYVTGADAKLLNEATVVALARDGTRTVLSMQNHYRGPPEGFALVVPVPVVLQKDDVKTLPRDVFDRLDRLTAPRLVEYWELDPCRAEAAGWEGTIMPGTAGGGGLAGIAEPGGQGGVKVEARFAVGEYGVVVLSASDSLGLEKWLVASGYRIPEGAATLLRPYVEGGMKFFVAKVDPAKVTFRDGAAALSPIRVQYDADTFTLPIRLGLLSSPGTQDLVVHILAPGQRYDVANRPAVTIPTNLEVTDPVRDRFGAFYAALFNRVAAASPGAAVTEYAWSTSTCDPCPVGALTQVELDTLGADARVPQSDATSRVAGPVGSAKIRNVEVKGGAVPNAASVVAGMTAGFRRCYNKGLQEDPNVKGSLRPVAKIGPNGEVLGVTHSGQGLSVTVISCAAARVASAQFAPPEGGSATVSFWIDFSNTSPEGGLGPLEPPASSPSPARPPETKSKSKNPVFGVPKPYVITRLHLRYGKDAPGEDLVFKAAPPIAGGNDWQADEQGAKQAPENRFQARYVLRHDWQGPIACAHPLRGYWGGPPKGVEAAPPQQATQLAFAPRGGVDLAPLLRAGVPSLGLDAQGPPIPRRSAPAASVAPAASAAPAAPPADAAPPAAEGAPSRGCGACGSGARAERGWEAIALLAAVLGTHRRRRRKRCP